MRYLVILFSIFLSSCATNYYLDENQLAKKSLLFEERVYIADKESENSAMLLEAGIYRVSESDRDSYKIQSIQNVQYPVCGMPMIGTIFTLGFLPGILPAYSYFEYEVVGPEGTKKYRHTLPIYSRTSIWEWLFKPFSGSERELEIKALRRSDRKIVDS